MSKSIYQLICDNLKDGMLPEGFSIPEPDSPDEFTWSPGSKDGVTLFYGMGNAGLNSAAARTMARALKAAAGKRYEEADSIFASLCTEYRAVSIIDKLQKYVVDHNRHLDPCNVYQMARLLILSSANIECVKIGLALMELFGEPSEDDKTMIRRIGLYDEFTLFAVWNMQKWETGNEDIFYLAKHTYSWGRIHAIRHLEPETEDIRRWIFTEGTMNGVINAYSALTCWQKSDAEAILFGSMTAEEYDAMVILIAALLDEDPAPGLSTLEDPCRILRQFLQQSGNFHLSWKDYDVIWTISRWLEDYDNEGSNAADLIAGCDVMLHSEACRAAVAEAVKTGRAIPMAKKLGLPYHAALFSCMKHNFKDCFSNCAYLMESPEYLEATLDIFREQLPLREMTGEPVAGFAPSEQFDNYTALNLLLQGLFGHPLAGCDFVVTALNSPYAMQRTGALRVLQSWVTATERPLAELSPELYLAVTELKAREINDCPGEMIAPLLEGKITFHEAMTNEYWKEEE